MSRSQSPIDFRTNPDTYKHWRLTIDGAVAHLAMDVSPAEGLRDDYELKLNSYDLSVDIELNDCIQRMRFEHPEVGAVIVQSGKDNVFCAGANIRMLAGATHAHKVNFCKFTNETRLAMEDASDASGQVYLCAITGSCAGGGYELALACEHILMADDRTTSVALPEVPLLGVLPGTGGLTRISDKRKMRRDQADVFCTLEEGIKGKRAVDWRLVDEVVPRTQLLETATARAEEIAARHPRPQAGIKLTPIARQIEADHIAYEFLQIDIDRKRRAAEFSLRAPTAALPETIAEIHAAGDGYWPLALPRQLEDAIFHMRFNEEEIGTWIFRSTGDPALVSACDAVLERFQDDWLIREIRLLWKRCLKRIDVSARTLITLIEPGSCFAGTLMELVLAADRSYMLDGQFEGDNRPPAEIYLTPLNFGPYPMGHNQTRLANRFAGAPDHLDVLRRQTGTALDAAEAESLGLVTFIPDDIDWEDEIRLAVEERAAFSADALTGMEASLRFSGPETMESKIFGRLSAWQNWIFQRPNAVGEKGALRVYGTGRRPDFNKGRV